MKLADPRPAYCSICGNTHPPEVPFYDLEASWDGPVMVNENMELVLAPGGAPSASEEVYVCDPCARVLTELSGHKPELHRKQLLEIRRLDEEVAHWRGYARRLEATLEERPERAPAARARVAA